MKMLQQNCDNIVFMLLKYCGQMLSQHYLGKFLKNCHNIVTNYSENMSTFK